MLFLIPAVFCILYFALIVVYSGITTDFCGIWLVFAAGFFLLFVYFRKKPQKEHQMPKRLPVFLRTTLVLFAAAALLIFSRILSGAFPGEETGCDYCIIPGARVYDDGISSALKKRLDTAKKVLEEYPDTVLVLSGGAGSGEKIPEALAMYNYLSIQGVPDRQMLPEPFSTSTEENFRFSRTVIEQDLQTRRIPPPVRIGVISSNFHMYRAKKIAERVFEDEITGIPAPSDKILLLHFTVREVFAVLKDFLMGNITVGEVHGKI